MNGVDRLVADRVMGWVVIKPREVNDQLMPEQVAQWMMVNPSPIEISRIITDRVNAKNAGVCAELVYDTVLAWVNEVGVGVAQLRSGMADAGSIKHPNGDYGWSPSTTIGDAWEVVERIMHNAPVGRERKGDDWGDRWRGENLWFAVECPLADNPRFVSGYVPKFTAGWKYNEQYEGDGYTQYQATEATAPLAICIAALKTVGVSQEEITAALTTKGTP